MYAVCGDPFHRKCLEPVVTDASDEHIPWCLFWIGANVGYELCNCFSHQVWFIHLILIANGGHVFFEGQRHPKTRLVRVFGHRQFLSSFWILEITRFTVSSIRFSFGLLDGVLFCSPNWILSLGFCWSFFIRFTPVQQSLQEYLGVLVDDSVEWILENILKRNPDVNVLR